MKRDGKQESAEETEGEREREEEKKMFCKKNFAPQKYLWKSFVPENYKALKIIHQKHAYTLNVLMDFSTLALCA